MSTIDVLARHEHDLTELELDGVMVLALAIRHAIAKTEALPSTLDPRARALIVTKLQEADHWCLELTRIAAK